MRGLLGVKLTYLINQILTYILKLLLLIFKNLLHSAGVVWLCHDPSPSQDVGIIIRT